MPWWAAMRAPSFVGKQSYCNHIGGATPFLFVRKLRDTDTLAFWTTLPTLPGTCTP